MAALTLPTLISDYKVKATVSKLKRNYSIISQVAKLAVNEYGELSTWGLEPDTKESVELITSRIKPYLKLMDDCGTGRCESYTQEYYHIDGTTQQFGDVKYFNGEIYYKLRLADGTEWFIRSGTETFGIFIDLNGQKVPNSLGRDIFYLYVSSNDQVVPGGVGKDPQSPGWEYCNPQTGQGWYCAGWVMYKENMDYLKCADQLSWSGQTKCK